MEERKNSFWKELIRIALPISLQYLINMVLIMVDNIMIGRLREANITAVSICTTYIWLATTFFMGLSEGLVIVSARAYGHDDKAKIKRTYSLVISLNVIVGVLFFLVTSFFPRQIISIYTDIDEVIQPAVEYLNIARWSVLFSSISTSTVMLFQAMKQVKIGLVNTIVSCTVKVILNYLFIYGNFGMPALGVRGAALSTTVSRSLELIVMLIYLFKVDRNLRFRLTDFSPEKDRSAIAELFVITYPLLIIDVLNNLVSSVQTMITGHISEYYVAANSIVHNSWVLPSISSFGLSMAAGVMVGNEIGRGKAHDIDAYGRKFLKIALILGLINASSVQLMMPIISSFYNVEAATLDLARRMSYFASITTFFNTFSNIVCTGVIKASGKTRILLIIDLLSNWIIAIPLGYLAAFVLKWPVELLYIILRGGNIFKSIWGADQILRSKWFTVSDYTDNTVSS